MFDWTLEFLIRRVTDQQTTGRLREIVENNLGSFWLEDVPTDIRRQILTQWQQGLIVAAEKELPDTDQKADVLRKLQELVDLTYRIRSPR